VAAWIKIDNWSGAWDSIVTKGDIEGNYDLIRARETNGIAFCVKGTSALIAMGTVDVVSDGQWHHAVGVYDYTSEGVETGTISVYIDGVLDVSVQCSGGLLAKNDKEVWINGLAEAERHADCTIDDVRIYSKALWQGEIEMIMGKPTATNPNPRDGALHVDNNADLSWTGRVVAVSYDVYFGTSESAVASASRLSGDIDGDGPVSDPDLQTFSQQWLSSPGNPSADLDGDGNVNLVDYAILASNWLRIPDPVFQGTQSSTTFDPGTMDADTTYYWRIDTVNDSEPSSPWKGEVWSFTTRHNEAQDITTNLIAHWKLDETSGATVYDNIGSNNGTLIGSPAWTTGAPDGLNPTGALDFPGGTHYVNCGNHSSLNITGRRSVAAWIKIDNWSGAWDSIVTKGDIEGNYDLIRARETNGIAFCVKGTSALIAMGTVDVVSDGQWHHAVGVYDYTSEGVETGTISVYIDGVLDVSVQCSGGLLAKNDKEVWINGLAEAERHADCTIDDVRIYSKALWQGEIEMIMGKPTATNPNPRDEN